MQLDIEAINVDVREKKSPLEPPLSTKGAKGKHLVPKLDLALGTASKAPETPRSSSQRKPGGSEVDIRLPTMHEEDYEHDPMKVGHMATTNVSHDSTKD